MKVLFFYFFNDGLESLRRAYDFFLRQKDNSDFLIINETNYTDENLKDYLKDKNLLVHKHNLENTEFKTFEILKTFYSFYFKYDYVVCFNSKFKNINEITIDRFNEDFVVVEGKSDQEYSMDFFIFKPKYNFFNKYNYFFLNKNTGKIIFDLKDRTFYNMLDFFNMPLKKIKTIE